MKLRPEEITSILKSRIEQFDQHGGTHGSPMGPLLRAGDFHNRSWASAGQSPAPPANGSPNNEEIEL